MLGLVGAPRLKIVRWQTWRTALRENHKEKHGESENDPDAVGTVARGKLRSQQQGCPRVSGQPFHHGGRRSEEEWRVRAARHRPSGTRGPQSSHGAQPGDWRGHQDRGQEGREVPRGQEREGRDRSAEEGEVVLSRNAAAEKSETPRCPNGLRGGVLFSGLLIEAETTSAQRAGRSSKPTLASFLRPSLRHPSRLS